MEQDDNNVLDFPVDKVEHVPITCCECQFVFHVPRSFKEQRHGDHKSFWCPRCGTSQSYTEPEVSKLRREVSDLKVRLTAARRLRMRFLLVAFACAALVMWIAYRWTP